MMRALFWILWAIAALVGAVALFFFVWGLSDGTVSSFNIGMWTALLAVVAVVVGGSLWLKSAGRPGLGVLLLLVLAAPGGFFALFMMVVLISGERWN